MASSREASDVPLTYHLMIATRTLSLAIHVARSNASSELTNRVIKDSFDKVIEDLENFENHPDASLLEIQDPNGDGLIPAKPIVNDFISELQDNRERYINDNDYKNQHAIDFFLGFVETKLLPFQTIASNMLALQQEHQGQEGGRKRRKQKTKRHRKKRKTKRRRKTRRKNRKIHRK